MKLLFDENLSPKLPNRLSDLFPNSLHVRDVGMQATIDPIVWDYAKDNDLIIVSEDFYDPDFLAAPIMMTSGIAGFGDAIILPFLQLLRRCRGGRLKTRGFHHSHQLPGRLGGQG